MGARILAMWKWLPAIVRGLLTSFVIVTVGTNVSVVPLVGNLKFHPQIPWALPATIVLLAVLWFYLRGGGFPVATRAARQRATRRTALPAPVWRAALVVLVLSVVAIASFRLLLPALLPVSPPRVPFDASTAPALTAWGILLALALSAGVVEEIAFRGYLQKTLEDAYGIVPALLVTGFTFWLAHASKVTLTYLPYHMLASILLGLVVYLTDSLLPAIAAHAIVDAALLPVSSFAAPAFARQALSAAPVWSAAHAATWAEKLNLIWQAVQPSNLADTANPHFTLAVLMWLFVVSLTLCTAALVRLARVSQQHRLA